MKLQVSSLCAAIILLSGAGPAYGFVTPEKSCIHDQFFKTCLDMYDAGSTINNYINNSYYNVTGGSGEPLWEDGGWFLTTNSSYADSVLIPDNLTVYDDIYLGADRYHNQSLYFTGTDPWFIRYDKEGDMLTTNPIWEFQDTINLGSALYAPIVTGGDIYSYGDLYTTGSNDDFWLGGTYMSQAEMVIQQNGNVDFRTPNFTIASTGEVGIGTDAPAEMLDVNGNVTADDFITKSLAYSGDATGLLQGIRPEEYNGEFSKVDHSSMGELAVERTYKVPVKEYRNVTVCEDVKVPTKSGATITNKVCRVDERETIVGYDTLSYEGVSMDKTIAVLIKANQELAERVKVLEERLGVKA